MKKEKMGPLEKKEVVLQDLVCYHCGEACENEKIHKEDKLFCCEGCKLVYEILEENSLCSYYSIEPGSGNSPKEESFSGKFAYLDREDIREKLIHFRSETQNHITFYIPGIHCSSCIWLLEHLQRIDSGILNSTVNFPKKELSLVYNPTEVELSRIAEIMTMIGYEPHISLNDIDSSSKKKVDRSAWYKIGVAGFCFGNIMMLSFPEYFSIAEADEIPGLRSTFSLLNLGLAIPVLLYSASDFFKSAWGALRARQLNIDLPVAAAILMCFLRSIYELAYDIGPGYFDSMAGIVFFMLIGRAFQNKTYETLNFDRDYKSYFPVAVSVADGNSEQRLPVTALKKGMRMIIRNAEIIPADAILIQGNGLIDYSFVTGESKPVQKKSGDLIYAGGKHEGTRIELEIVKQVKQSYLTTLWNKPAFQKDDAEEKKASLENKINRYFTISVFIISALAAGYWIWQGDNTRLINSVTTILIVACPCILLLAATFTQGNVLRILGRKGMFLRNAFVIEKLSKADAIVFDKTGTLTKVDQKQLQFSSVLKENEQVELASICAHSNHPLSRVITSIFSNHDRLQVSNYVEIAGKGLSGTVNGITYYIGSAQFVSAEVSSDASSETRVYIRKEMEILGYFKASYPLREGMSEVLQKLSKDKEIYILSGDNESDKSYFSRWFDESNMHFNQKPEQKLEFIKRLKSQGKTVMMVGDGLNDAGALQESDSGIAVSDNLNNFSPSCDAILDGKQMTILHTFLEYCKDSNRVIAISFALSTLYNIIGLYFAVQGELQPVIAAILMPTASITIVSFATLLSSLLAKTKGI